MSVNDGIDPGRDILTIWPGLNECRHICLRAWVHDLQQADAGGARDTNGVTRLRGIGLARRFNRSGPRVDAVAGCAARDTVFRNLVG